MRRINLLFLAICVSPAFVTGQEKDYVKYFSKSTCEDPHGELPNQDPGTQQ